MVRLGALIIAHVPAVRPGLRNRTVAPDTCGIPVVPRFPDGPYRVENNPSQATIRLAGFTPSVRDSNLVIGASGSAVNADDELSVEPGSS